MNIEQVGFIVMDGQSSRQPQDLLSDLPLGIIHIILSFVPIRDAVRTSFLSKQWRYIWTSLPYLVFVYPPMETRSDEKRLIHFINQALLHHKGPILELQLRLPFLDMYSRFKILSSPYSCHNLTLLKLHIPTLPPPLPSFKGFLFLRSLDISARVDSSTVETIVTHSPLLEELTLHGSIFSEMTIRAPNLKFFRFRCGSTHLTLYTPVLEEFIVNFSCIEHFSFHESLMFHHLRYIKLYGVPFNRAEVAVALIRLITRSPNLQKLKIESLSSWSDGAPERACVSFWDPESVPNFTYDSLKEIKMTYDCGIDEIKLAKFLLARSPVLERMIYRPRSSLSEQVLLNLTAELRNCRRASANAEIEID